MDFSNKQEEVEDDEEPLVLGKERHDLLITAKRRVLIERSLLGTLLNIFLIIPFLLVIAGSVTSLSLFAYEDGRVHASSVYNNDTYGYCVLFAEYDASSTPSFRYGEGKTCELVIYSLTAVAITAALFCCGACVRGICGLAATSPLVVCDLVMLSLCSAAALSVGIVITFGRYLTCQAIESTAEDAYSTISNNCTSPAVVDNHGIPLDSDYIIRVSEMSVWATTILLLLLTLLHILLTLGFCYKLFRRKRRTRFLSIQADDNVPSPFSPPHLMDDDERMLDVARHSATPTLAFAEPSVPPMNEGYTTFQPSTEKEDPWSAN